MTPELTRLWIAEYVCARGSKEASYRLALTNLLERFQIDYQRFQGGGSFLDSIDNTRFFRFWAQEPPYLGWSESRRRTFLACLRGFTGWLFRQGRTNHDVYFYLTVCEAVQGRVDQLELRDGLQRRILAFETWLRTESRWRSDWMLATHHYNRYRSQPGSPLEETECLLKWVREVACTVSPRRAPVWISGLVRFFDFTGRPELRNLLRDCRSFSAALRALVDTEKPLAEALKDARRPGFESGLAGWLQALLHHRAGRQMKLHGWPSALRRLDRIALRNGVQEPEQLTGAMVEEFLAGSRAGTRNARLSKLRALARFLAPRGARLELSGWLTAPVPPFRPHLYTLQEVGRILQSMQERGHSRRAFHWLGLEMIVFLLYACGMRRREPLGLRVQDVHIINRALFLDDTKFYKQRWVPLGDGAVRRLAHYLEQRQRVFPGRDGADEAFFLNDNGQAFGKSVLQVAFSRVRRSLGLQSRGTRSEPRLHDLRHSLAVHRLYQWYAEGADVQNKLPLLSAYLGHERLQHTEVYLNLTEDLVRQAGKNFLVSFEQIVGRVVDNSAGPA